MPQALPFPILHNQQLLNQMMISQQQKNAFEAASKNHQSHMASIPTPLLQNNEKVMRCSPASNSERSPQKSGSTKSEPIIIESQPNCSSIRQHHPTTSPLDLTTAAKSPEAISEITKSDFDRLAGKPTIITIVSK